MAVGSQMPDLRELFGMEAPIESEPKMSAALLIRLLEALLADRGTVDEQGRRELELRVRPRIEPLGG